MLDLKKERIACYPKNWEVYQHDEAITEQIGFKWF
jgi:hypothetical protein